MNVRALKSGLPKIAAISGVKMSATSDATTRAERGADDDGDGQVDDVAAQDELAELLDHAARFVPHARLSFATWRCAA